MANHVESLPLTSRCARLGLPAPCFAGHVREREDVALAVFALYSAEARPRCHASSTCRPSRDDGILRYVPLIVIVAAPGTRPCEATTTARHWPGDREVRRALLDARQPAAAEAATAAAAADDDAAAQSGRARWMGFTTLAGVLLARPRPAAEAKRYASGPGAAIVFDHVLW